MGSTQQRLAVPGMPCKRQHPGVQEGAVKELDSRCAGADEHQLLKGPQALLQRSSRALGLLAAAACVTLCSQLSCLSRFESKH